MRFRGSKKKEVGWREDFASLLPPSAPKHLLRPLPDLHVAFVTLRKHREITPRHNKVAAVKIFIQ